MKQASPITRRGLLIGDHVRSADAVAASDGLLIELRHEEFQRLVDRDPGLVSYFLRRAILVAEDDAFYQHGGLDWNEIQASARVNLEKHKVVRGGSTITQQLAKNLFLGDARTPWRKLEEVFLAWRIERALSKRRIFELYLNFIEWGNGVFGAEAAAQRYFGVPAARLSAEQAARLAAMAPNPRFYEHNQGAPGLNRKIRIILARMPAAELP